MILKRSTPTFLSFCFKMENRKSDISRGYIINVKTGKDGGRANTKSSRGILYVSKIVVPRDYD